MLTFSVNVIFGHSVPFVPPMFFFLFLFPFEDIEYSHYPITHPLLNPTAAGGVSKNPSMKVSGSFIVMVAVWLP